MELGKKIKYYRNEKSLTQDNLAERIFVSRKTISNWENDKSYPDISSIILLSEVLEVSVDNLIKGDVEQMKVEINSEEVKKMKLYSLMMLIYSCYQWEHFSHYLNSLGFMPLFPVLACG